MLIGLSLLYACFFEKRSSRDVGCLSIFEQAPSDAACPRETALPADKNQNARE